MLVAFWVSLILFVSGLNQGFSGFGVILVALPLLTLILDIKSVVPLIALSAVVIAIMLFLQLKERFDFQKIKPLLIGAIPGIPIGVFVLKEIDTSIIQWVLGLILIMYALYRLLISPRKQGIRESWAYLFGLLSGIMAGVLSAAAPPIIVYLTLQSWDKDQIKVSLQAFFIISGSVVVVFHALTGLTTLLTLKLFAISTPPLLLGTYLGSLLYGRINENQYRKVMFVFLGLLGIFTMWRAM
jgi:hypothetical protein